MMFSLGWVVLLALPASLGGTTLSSSRAAGLSPESGPRLIRESSSAKEEVIVVSSLGGTVPLPRRARVMDAALATEMSRDVAGDAVVGAAVDIGERCVVVVDCGTTGDEVEAGAFAAASSHLVVLHVWRSDIGRCVAANANALRALREGCRLFTAKGQPAKKIGLVLCAHDADDGVVPAYTAVSVDAAVVSEVKAACDGDVSFCSSIVGASGAEGVGSAVREFATGVSSAKAARREDLGSLLASSWAKSRSPVSPEDAAIFASDAAFSRRKELAESAFSRWSRDVDDGRLAPKGWAADAAEVYRDCLAKYDAATLAHWAEPARAQRRDHLDDLLFDEIRKCHLKQLDLASAKRLRKLKVRLEQAAAQDPRGELDPAKADDLVADAEYLFDSDATRCGVPSLGLHATDHLLRFRDAAKRLAADFPDTPAAQLLAAKAEERNAKKQAPKSKITSGPGSSQPPRSKSLKNKDKPITLNWAMQLVGMLRPRGYGNAQAFCNYALGQHSILFGFSDDRDVAGDMSYADEIPLLRLQPKLTLDLDM